MRFKRPDKINPTGPPPTMHILHDIQYQHSKNQWSTDCIISSINYGKKLGPRGIRTPGARFKVWSDNRYTIGPPSCTQFSVYINVY